MATPRLGSFNSDVRGVYAAVNALGTLSSATTISLANGAYQTLNFSAAVSLSFSGWPAAGQVGDLYLEMLNGATYALTFAHAINWVGSGGAITVGAGGSGVPSGVTTLGTSASVPDFIYLWSRDGGTTIYGRVMR